MVATAIDASGQANPTPARSDFTVVIPATADGQPDADPDAHRAADAAAGAGVGDRAEDGVPEDRAGEASLRGTKGREGGRRPSSAHRVVGKGDQDAARGHRVRATRYARQEAAQGRHSTARSKGQAARLRNGQHHPETLRIRAKSVDVRGADRAAPAVGRAQPSDVRVQNAEKAASAFRFVRGGSRRSACPAARYGDSVLAPATLDRAAASCALGSMLLLYVSPIAQAAPGDQADPPLPRRRQPAADFPPARAAQTESFRRRGRSPRRRSRRSKRLAGAVGRAYARGASGAASPGGLSSPSPRRPSPSQPPRPRERPVASTGTTTPPKPAPAESEEDEAPPSRTSTR